jgi:hypothetical protein
VTTRKRLTKKQIAAETRAVIKSLDWAKSPEGIDYHRNNIGTDHEYGILAGMLEDMVVYGVDKGYNPAYLVGYLTLRMRGRYREFREDFDKIFDLNGLDGMWLNEEDKQLHDAYLAKK